MIAIDGKLINDYPTDDEVRVFVEKALTEIKKKKTYTLAFHPRLVRKKSTFEPDSYDETSQGIAFKATQRMSFGSGQHEITYYKSYRIRENTKVFNNPTHLDYGQTLVLDSEKEADLVFAYVCMSPFCQEFEPLKKFQNSNKLSPIYFVEDKVADAKAAVELERALNKVRNILFEEDSITESKLKELAVARGIKNAATTDIDLVRNALKNVILKQTKGRYDLKVMKEFIADAEGSGVNTKLKAAIENAIQKEIIGIKTGQSKDAYFTLTGDKSPKNKIADVPKKGDQKAALYDALQSGDKKTRENFIEFAEAGLPSQDKDE